MSITESLRGVEQELNIHDLAVEPEAEKPEGFDALEVISDEDWKTASHMLDGSHSIQDNMRFSHMMTAIKISFPEKFNDLEIDKSKATRDIQDVIDYLIAESGHRDENEYELKKSFLFPEPSSRVSPLFDAENYVGFLVRGDQPSRYTEAIDLVKIMSVIDHQRTREFLEREGNGEILYQECCKRLEEQKRDGKWNSFAFDMSALRVIWPERFSSAEVDDSAKKGMLAVLKELESNPKKTGFISLAAAMQVLEARELVFGKEGLRLVMPIRQGFKETKPDLPVRKQF